MKRRPHDIVEVAWVDSHVPPDAWTDFADIEKFADKPFECRSIGYVLHENRECLALAASIGLSENDEHGDIGQVAGVMNIPKRAITERRVLSKGRR